MIGVILTFIIVVAIYGIGLYLTEPIRTGDFIAGYYTGLIAMLVGLIVQVIL